MQTGSNPVGVASSNSNENQGLENRSCTSEQALAHRWPKAGDRIEVNDGTGRGWEPAIVMDCDGRTIKANYCNGEPVGNLRCGDSCWRRWPEGAREEATPAQRAEAAEKPKRKAPKEGLCKRRGCKNQVHAGSLAERLCAHHAGLQEIERAVAQASEGKTTDPLALYGVTGGTMVEVFHGVEGQMWKRCEVVTVGSGGFTIALGTFYAWAEKGKTWRECQAQDATALDDVRCDDVDPEKEKELAAAMVLDAGLEALRRTPNVCQQYDCLKSPEVAGYCRGHAQALGLVEPSPAVEAARAAIPALPVCRVCGDPVAALVECCERCQPKCSGCGVGLVDSDPKGGQCFACNERSRLPGPRTCKGLPPFQGPGEACDTVLGREVEGDRCAVCAEWMRVHGDCDGCNVRVPGWQVTGKLCAECKSTLRTNQARGERLASAMLARFEDGDKAEQPNDRRKLAGEILDGAYEDFYGALWETMLCDAELDRTTVEVCKRLRDDERLVRGGRR